MKNGYNLYNLLEIFKKWLLTKKSHKNSRLSKASLKNYLSDLRHFFGWLTIRKKINEDFEYVGADFSSLLSIQSLNKYITYLSENKVSEKTINRRLSALRKFCSFCIDQGWLSENPAKKIKNITNLKPLSKKTTLTEFSKYLISQKLEIERIQEILKDTKEFIEITS